MKAWEAIFLAHTEDFVAAERTAHEALALGGDDSVAWEALAVAAERQDKPLLALQHRIRAADAGGFPWIRDRARGLALLELEAWEAAEDWLMWCQAAVPANLEILLGLSRLPATTRAAAVEQVLASGPRGRVSPIEYYRWHEVSSGIVERMTDSLGAVDYGESAAMAVARGKASALLEDRAGAQASYARALQDRGARPIDRDRAEAGLISLARDESEFRKLLGRDAAEVAVNAANAPALIGWHSTRGQCVDVIRVGQLGLALGIAPRSFEGAATGCLSREVGWSLAEQALGRGPVLDRAALVLGQSAGSIPGPIEQPSLPFWSAFRERRFAEVAAVAPADWRGLAFAHLGQATAARDTLTQAVELGGDGAVISYAHSLLLQQEGDFTGSTLAALRAGDVDDGSPWVRAVARGIALSRVLRWGDAQGELLAALRVLPGYLEALEALSEVPQPLRFPAAEIALRYVPSGRVPAPRWAAWYRTQERFEEARLSLSWPEGVLPMDPRSRAMRALALGRIEAAEQQGSAARAAYKDAMDLAEELESKTLFCRAAARRALVSGEDVDDVELVVLEAVCNRSPDALDAIGRIAALRGECKRVHDYARKALEAGADPADVSGWMEPCSPAEYVDKWLPRRVRAVHNLPPDAAALLAHRVHPGEEDELPTADESAARGRPLLVRQLAGMARLAESSEARFIALTYPFPGAHHRRVRDTIIPNAREARIPLLDLYGHFESTYSEAEWQAMRTKEDHVNSTGYDEMGREILRYLKLRGGLPQAPP
jgi:tetratricopeptide (TPR) repeat protein